MNNNAIIFVIVNITQSCTLRETKRKNNNGCLCGIYFIEDAVAQQQMTEESAISILKFTLAMCNNLLQKQKQPTGGDTPLDLVLKATGEVVNVEFREQIQRDHMEEIQKQIETRITKSS
jgi:hypothetical protein